MCTGPSRKFPKRAGEASRAVFVGDANFRVSHSHMASKKRALDPEQLLNKEAARFIGMTTKTLQNWRKQGCQRAWNEDGTVSLPRLIELRMKYIAETASMELEEHDWKKDRTQYQALREKLKLRREQDEVISVAEAESVIVSLCAQIRGRLLQLPATMAQEEPAGMQAAKRKRWEAEIRDVLGVLSKCELPEPEA
jgi:phage terminase Nu1 subunit (DNA packaging protein)